jgi:predicted DNA-binding protein (MmcQ/YjbR family)
MKQISSTEDTWGDEESLPVTPDLKVIRVNDPWYGMSEEEEAAEAEMS